MQVLHRQSVQRPVREFRAFTASPHNVRTPLRPVRAIANKEEGCTRRDLLVTGKAEGILVPQAAPYVLLLPYQQPSGAVAVFVLPYAAT